MDVFVSYASADRDKARAIARLLTEHGYSVWWDRQIPPGQTFDDVIQKALEEAKCVVVLWSSASVSSNWVKTEAADAAARRILVPALIDDVRLPMEFKRIQTANLVAWDSGPTNTEFQNLLASVRSLAEHDGSQAAVHQTATSGLRADPAPRSAASSRGRYIAMIVAATLLALAGAFYALLPRDRPATTTVTQAEAQPKAAVPAIATDAAPVPPVVAPRSATPVSRRINLLAKENGGQVVVAPDKIWLRSIDDYEDMQAWSGIGEAVFAFKDEAPATFDTFLVLIPNTSDANLHQFELLAGNESATGTFSTIGQFATQNVRIMNAPFQAFKFDPVKARYLKVKVLTDFRDRKGSAALHKFQLMGSLD